MVTVELNSFGKLRELANQLGGLGGPSEVGRLANTKLSKSTAAAAHRRIVTAAAALGPVAVPMLVRRFVQDCAARTLCQAALVAIAEIAAAEHGKVVAELRKSLFSLVSDDARVAILALLHQLGSPEPGAQFVDPAQVQRDAARALAKQLNSPADIARAAALMITQLPVVELLAMVELVVADAPTCGAWLTDELLARLDLDAAIRAELRRIAAGVRVAAPVMPQHAGEPALATLAHPSGAVVVVVEAAPLAPVELRRAIAFLVDATGVLVDATYQEPASRCATSEWMRGLVTDGYTETQLERIAARSVVAAAARRAVADNGELPAAYYLGRDLLQLGNAHLGMRAGQEIDSTWSVAAGYGVDLLAAGEVTSAFALLAQCVARDAVQAAANADVAGAYGMACLALEKFAEAVHWLAVATAADPSHADHAWNWACAAERNHDDVTLVRALTQYCLRAERGHITSSVAARLEVARVLLVSVQSAAPPLDKANVEVAAVEAVAVIAARPRRTKRNAKPAPPTS
ncbi:MAG: hypothetical protein KBG15_13815 [Kofleriaceae bacterium]|nr:hypothetical protein [Kofleriaceae bacterium]